MKQLIVLFILWLGLMPLKSNAQILTDTLWSVPNLDGEISYRPVSGIYGLGTSATYFFAGDGWDGILSQEAFVRAFLSFDLSEINYTDSLEIDRAFVCIYQYDCFGNNQQGVYPIWDVAGGDTHFCVLDHINYGSSLDLGDWTAGDPGDPQTLQTNTGIISADSILGYKTLEVTPWLKQDITDSLMYNQYRVRFTINSDYDTMNDYIFFISGDSYFYPKPFLSIIYKDVNTIIENNSASQLLNLNQNYPNPFNNNTTIRYSIPFPSYVKLAVYDILGKEIATLVNENKSRGEHVAHFDGSLVSSGVYFCRLNMNRNLNKTIKIFLMK